LDFSTTIYDSTGQDNFFITQDKEVTLTVSQLNLFLRQIMTSVDLTTLGSAYFNQLASILPLTNMSLTDYDNHLIYGSTTVNPGACVELIATACQTTEAAQKRIYYTFKHAPSASAMRVLAQLHELFCQQLDHAISFRQLRQMATKDTLTGLGNRNGFNEACQRLMCRAQRHEETFGLLVIDLDNFKQVNDNFGHQEGDNVLVHVSSHISQVLRGADEAFRFGGDEFCSLLDCEKVNHLNAVASRLQSALSQSTYLRRFGISCSIGGAIYREDDDISSLFSRADSALYQVKQSGKGAFRAA